MQGSYFKSIKTGKSYPIVFRDDPPCGADREVFFAPQNGMSLRMTQIAIVRFVRNKSSVNAETHAV